ncbi:TldD/PmbA family protein [Streptomyces sp. PRKS01-65]|nr:TldD/PmbA family protein [Streptomyces harenosi]NEY30960.1 TldD/PmbA family protein [Streptomyces harenosi]
MTDLPHPGAGGFDPAALSGLADVALRHAHGVTHLDFRAERVRTRRTSLSDGVVRELTDEEHTGFAVRLVHDGTWGWSADARLTADAVDRATREALGMAASPAPAGHRRVVLAPEPPHHDLTWSSAFRIDPFTVPAAERNALLVDWSRTLLGHAGVDHVDVTLTEVSEEKFYADLHGTLTFQRRIRLHPELMAVSTGDRQCGVRMLAPPAGRGWEYLLGEGWDFAAELRGLPGALAEARAARPVRPGRYDLVVDSTHLWMPLHESVGHATELDRALGDEAGFAGGTFATPGRLGSLRYGSSLLNVTADRTVPHGLATVGYDDEGVRAQSWDLVRDGVFVGYQTDRETAGRLGLARSTGCAFAESAAFAPMQRMPNVSLEPAAAGPRLDELISAVDDGIYLAGEGSYSIDMQRRNFQFTADRARRIRRGRLAEPLDSVAYQADTLEFWHALAALGGPSTYVLNGALDCGKGQPGQLAPVSHGAPAAVFTGIRVLHTGDGVAL